MAFKYMMIGAASLLPFALYAQEVTLPTLPDFEVAPPVLDVSALKDTGLDEAASSETATAEEAPTALELPSLKEEAEAVEAQAPDLAVPDFPFEEAEEQAAPAVEAVEDPFADLALPALEADAPADMTATAAAEDDFTAPAIPDVAQEELDDDALPDFEANMPTLPPLEENVAEVDAPALPTTPEGLPLLTLPPLPGETGDLTGNAPITFGSAAQDSDAEQVAKKPDPNKKYAGKMPRNPGKKGIAQGYNFKRQYVPNEIYKSRYRLENQHLPTVQSIQHYERAFFKAAMENRVNDMRALRSHIETVNLRGDNGVTPLMAASYSGAHDAVVYLLQHEANRDSVNFSGNTAMDYASMKGDRVAVGLLRGDYYVVAELAR